MLNCTIQYYTRRPYNPGPRTKQLQLLIIYIYAHGALGNEPSGL